jgi:protein-S-isoprenylcysteine O-methyltransferase Ste14
MNRQQGLFSPRLIVQVLLLVVVVPFLPLLISARWHWWEAWVYAAVSILTFAISRMLAARRHPDLIAERARILQHEDMQHWDKQLAPLLGIGGGLVLLVAGLDARFGWSPTFSLGWKILSLAIILAGYVLGSYALIENRFFSGVVRLQTERGHQVVSSGPYRWMRHPGYAGALLSYLAMPVLLDSLWAYLPTIFTTIVLIVRARLEDGFLRDELDGYSDYARRVRYRLLPGVW